MATANTDQTTRLKRAIGKPRHAPSMRREPQIRATISPTEQYEDAVVTSENGRPTGNTRASEDEKMRALHEKLRGWFYAEAMRQANNRTQMAIDEAFYDGEQWKADRAALLAERNQDALVYNECKPTVDWLIGTERRARVDFFVVSEEGDEAGDEDAQNKTKMMKWLDDTNRAAFERSQAANDCFKAGIGWLEVGLRGDDSGAPIYIGAERWRNMLHDSLASKLDTEDWRYIFRIKVVDLDIAEAIFPDKVAELQECMQDGDSITFMRDVLGGLGNVIGLDQFGQTVSHEDYVTSKPVDLFNPRKRVLLIEAWWREPVKRQVQGKFGMGDPLRMRMHCGVMTERHMLVSSESPLRHDQFPFIPMWCYRNARTGLPYGVIRQIRSPQVGLNERMTKALYEASANGLMADADAFDPEVMTVAEVQREQNTPDGVAVFAKGAMATQKVRERKNPENVQHQLALADRDTQAIRTVSGIDNAARGSNDNVVSGKALLAKNENTSLMSGEIFDNLLLGRQMEGERTLSMAEQFIVQPINVRVAGEGGAADRVKLNQPSHYELDPETGESVPVYLNDITARRAHFVVGEQAWKQSYAEASFESLMLVLTQLAPAAPQAVINLLDLVFEMHPHLPRKKAIVERIRAINGQTDPNGKMTPEQQAAIAQQQAQAKAEFDLLMARMKAEVVELEAKGEKLSTDAMMARVTAIYEAAQAATALAVNGALVPVTDQLLRSAGFVDKDTPAVLDNMGGMAAAAAPALPDPNAPPIEQPGLPPPAGAPVDQAMPAEAVM